MTISVNLRKMLHRKSAEYCAVNPAGNTATGTFIMSDRDSLLPENDGIMYVGGVSAIWTYNADEDSWQQGPNSGATGTFGAGSCGCLRAIFAPGGASSSTATAGTTTSITTSLAITKSLANCAIRVISGTGIGYQGIISKNTVGASSVLTVSPSNSVAFDSTTVFQIMSGSAWLFVPGSGTVGFSVYDRATNTWTTRSVTNLPTTFGTDGSLISTSSIGTSYVSSTSTGSNTSTTLNDTTKTWPTNGWTNSQVRITSGTGVGQIRTISSNSSTTLSVSTAWTTTPDSTSVYKIEGNDDYMYLMGNNAVTLYRYSVSGNTWSTITPSTARGGAFAAGGNAHFIDGVTDTAWTDGTYGYHYATTILKQNGRYIYSFRGGASNTLDVYDISANTWINALSYGQQFETFTTGSCSVDVAGEIFIQKDATGRIYRFSVSKNSLTPFTTNPVPQSTAIVGQKMFITTFREDSTVLRYLYTLGNTRLELTRWLII